MRTPPDPSRRVGLLSRQNATAIIGSAGTRDSRFGQSLVPIRLPQQKVGRDSCPSGRQPPAGRENKWNAASGERVGHRKAPVAIQVQIEHGCVEGLRINQGEGLLDRGGSRNGTPHLRSASMSSMSMRISSISSSTTRTRRPEDRFVHVTSAPRCRNVDRADHAVRREVEMHRALQFVG